MLVICTEWHVKIIVDLQGRFVIVTGSLTNIAVVLANLYAPKWDDESFSAKMISSLPDLESHHLILGIILTAQ